MEPILIVISIGTALNLGVLLGLGLWIRHHLDQSLMELDEKLALAIQSIVDKMVTGGLSDFEPPNPIQGAIAQLIQGMAAQKLNTFDATVVSRGPDGTFESPMKKFE